MIKWNSVTKYISCILLLLYIGIIVFLNLITPDKIFSDSENRILEQAPNFSFKELFKGKFTENYEKYIADQFTLRDFWIGIKSDCQGVLGNKESNGVYSGKDGYLLQSFKEPENRSFQEKMEAINSFAQSIPKVNKYFMLVPNSVKILQQKLPSYAPVDDELVAINKVKASVDKSIKFVDIYDALYSKRDEYIYYKTDHHWTTKGAYYAYEKIAKDMGFSAHEENYFNVKKVTDSFYGSLYSEGGFRHIKPDSMELYIPKTDENYTVEYYDENRTSNSFFNMNNLSKKDKYTVFFGGNYSFIKINMKNTSDKKLLVVKDSYANCFLPFLCDNFSEIYVIDLRYYDESLNALIKSNAISDLLILYNVNTFFQDSSINNISR